jgi:hypothetical protein
LIGYYLAALRTNLSTKYAIKVIAAIPSPAVKTIGTFVEKAVTIGSKSVDVRVIYATLINKIPSLEEYAKL